QPQFLIFQSHRRITATPLRARSEKRMTAQDYKAPESVGRLQQSALAIGCIALILALFGAVRSPELFYPSYLMSFMLILGLALGSLGLVMLQHLTSGHWGIIIRRPLESAMRTLPLVAAFFLPIAFIGMKYLYGAWLDIVLALALAGSWFGFGYEKRSGGVTRAVRDCA